ncbi:AzlD domain-containing protein [Streptomyces sp. NPDC020379]|uniref:AzlD domain-containing protein n=1 Tax=Streptomyces sp. NPDC020379 TaxID=3365071 RepID=UPI00379DF0FF
MFLTLLIIGMAACAFATRYLPIVLFQDRELPDAVKTALNYVPGAVLAALVFPEVVTPMYEGGGEWAVPTLVGGIVTLIAGRLVKNFLAVAAIGVVTFFVLRQLLGA